MPLAGLVEPPPAERMTSVDLLAALRFVQDSFDQRFGDDGLRAATGRHHRPRIGTPGA
jgi:hypothetical protein